MKIITLLGSPRKRGNTAAILSAFEAMVPAPHQVERINVTDHSIKGCLGCDACRRKLDVPGCVQRDDFAGVMDRLLAADVIVYASPLYAWDFTAQMKCLFDRHYCLVKWVDGQVASALMRGKRAALLVTCGDVAENNADVIQTIFDRQMAYLGCTIVGKHVVASCSTPDKLGDRAVETAKALLNGILASESK